MCQKKGGNHFITLNMQNNTIIWNFIFIGDLSLTKYHAAYLIFIILTAIGSLAGILLKGYLIREAIFEKTGTHNRTSAVPSAISPIEKLKYAYKKKQWQLSINKTINNMTIDFDFILCCCISKCKNKICD